MKVKIASLVLSYGYGQPTKRSEVSGPDGGPIQKQELIINASERVAAAFADVVDADDPAKALDDQGLNAIQAVGQQEGKKRGRVSVSTGRVVDFRAREHLRPDPTDGTVPLIGPANGKGVEAPLPAANCP